MFQLIPITQTSVDWPNFLTSTNTILGRDPLVELNKNWVDLKRNLSEYLSSLKTIFGNENEKINVFGDGGALLSHVSISFILVALKQTTFKIATNSRLLISTTESKHEDIFLSIISGNLEQWRSAILNCCSDEVNYDIRLFGNKAQEYFESTGLYKFMINQTVQKIPMLDNTFRLIERK